MKPAKTIARLHFEDLSHERFEDMCVQLIYNLKPWADIQHFGRKGKDGGVDIYGEVFEENTRQKWVIQCKRYKEISLKQLQAILDDFLNKNRGLPDRYLLLLGCDVGRGIYEKLQKFAKEKGFPEVNIMTASILEAELYARHPDILYAFFGVQVLGKRAVTVAKVKQRLAMKKKVERELTRALRNRASAVIIHDVHRGDIYPGLDSHTPGISPWFKLEYFQTYYRGISFCLDVVTVLVEQETGRWRLTEYNSNAPTGWVKINAFQLGNIPYDNVVDFDVDGDEYYPFPHLYCEFSNLGQPYEEIWYKPTDDFKDQVFRLPKDHQMT